MPETGDAMASFLRRAFAAAHPGVVTADEIAVVATEIGKRRAAGGAVVGHENEERVVGELQLLETRSQAADVVIDVGNHPVKRGEFFVAVDFVDIRSGPFFGDAVRSVRSVRREINEKRLLAMGFNKPRRLAEKD